MSAAAPHFALLIGGRILQGVGTGVALPLMFNIVLQQVPHERMGTMMGLATLITAIAPAVGPSLGGFLIGALGWRSIFLVLVPFLVIALVLGTLTIRQAQGDRAGLLRPRPVPAHGGRVRSPHLRHQRRLHQRMDQPGGTRAVCPVRGAHCRFRPALPALRRSPAARADLHRPHLRVEHRLRGAHPGHRAGAGIPDPVLRPGRQVDGLLRRGLSTAARVHHRRAPHPVRRRDPGPLRSHAAHPHRRRHRGGDPRALRRPRRSRLGRSAGVDLRALPDLPGVVRLELHDQRPAFPSR